MAAGFHLARAQDQFFAQLHVPRDAGQRGFAHEFGARTRERAFVGLGPMRIEGFGDDQVDERVAEEFQPLVVDRCGAAVGERLDEQAGVGEFDPGQSRRPVSRTGHRG